MDKQMIISIGRQCGSGGREIGEKLAQHYGLKFYDRNIIEMLAADMEKDPENVAKVEEKLSGLLPKRRGGFEAKLKDLMNRLNSSDEMYLHERGLIMRLAETESFVIVGRGANDMMEGKPNVLRLFIYAPDDFRVPRVKAEYKLDSDSDAKKKMEQVDRERREYYEYYSGRIWGYYDQHDLMINSGLLGVDGTVDLIVSVADKKFGL